MLPLHAIIFISQIHSSVTFLPRLLRTFHQDCQAGRGKNCVGHAHQTSEHVKPRPTESEVVKLCRYALNAFQ